MKKYDLYKHPKLDRIVAVKTGFSWPAFFFSHFWMIFKGLWIYAGSYLMIGIILINLDKVAEKVAGKADSPILNAFLLIGWVAMLLVPGFMGNKWRKEQLKEQGYELVDSESLTR